MLRIFLRALVSILLTCGSAVALAERSAIWACQQHEFAVQNDSRQVFVTKTGSKYHKSSCQYLRSSRVAMALSEASKKHAPCLSCRPPSPQDVARRSLRDRQAGCVENHRDCWEAQGAIAEPDWLRRIGEAPAYLAETITDEIENVSRDKLTILVYMEKENQVAILTVMETGLTEQIRAEIDPSTPHLGNLLARGRHADDRLFLICVTHIEERSNPYSIRYVDEPSAYTLSFRSPCSQKPLRLKPGLVYDRCPDKSALMTSTESRYFASETELHELAAASRMRLQGPGGSIDYILTSEGSENPVNAYGNALRWFLRETERTSELCPGGGKYRPSD